MDNIGNLEELSTLVFIYEECGNFKVAHDGGEPTKEILTKRRRQALYSSL